MTADLVAHHRDALADGRLEFQRCTACGHAWLPPREACPACLAPSWSWQPASGRGHVVSWVVYHRAFDPSVGDRVPYNVAVVELAEGPRLVTNLLGVDTTTLHADAPVSLVVETDGDQPLARFRIA